MKTKCGRVVSAPDLKSSYPQFESRSDHQLDLFQVVSSSTPRLFLYITNRSAGLLPASWDSRSVQFTRDTFFFSNTGPEKAPKVN